jgi:hypothetical protein
VCVLKNAQSGAVLARHRVLLRLDYSNWFDGPWSLFFGSLISALVFCLAFIVLNLLWVLLRNLALWWIRRLGIKFQIEVYD